MIPSDIVTNSLGNHDENLYEIHSGHNVNFYHAFSCLTNYILVEAMNSNAKWGMHKPFWVFLSPCCTQLKCKKTIFSFNNSSKPQISRKFASKVIQNIRSIFNNIVDSPVGFLYFYGSSHNVFNIGPRDQQWNARDTNRMNLIFNMALKIVTVRFCSLKIKKCQIESITLIKQFHPLKLLVKAIVQSRSKTKLP